MKLGWKSISDLSFLNIYDWYEETRSLTEDDTVFILVGNKNDLEEERKVQYEAGEAMFKKLKMSLFFETSVKLDQNVQRAFLEAAKMVKIRQKSTNPKGIRLIPINQQFKPECNC